MGCKGMHQSCSNFKRVSKRKGGNDAVSEGSGTGGVKKPSVAATSALAIHGMKRKRTESRREVPVAGSLTGTGTPEEVKIWLAAKYAGMKKRELKRRLNMLLDEKADAAA